MRVKKHACGLAMTTLAALPTCAEAIFRACRMEVLQNVTRPPRLHSVSHAYLILHTRDRMRSNWQRVQLAQLGITVTLVLGYDGEDLLQHHLACLFPPPARFAATRSNRTGAPQQKYASQLVKLWSAAYHMRYFAIPRALVFEDDVVVHFSRLATLDAAVVHLNKRYARWSALFLSSYNPAGEDAQPTGLLEKHYVVNRTGGLMPGVATLLSARGALHLSTHIPIRARGLDMALSDSRESSAPVQSAFFLKPYPFTAGAFGSKSLFGCDFSPPCERTFIAQFSRTPDTVSATQLSYYVLRRRPTPQVTPPCFGCPHHGMARSRPPIRKCIRHELQVSCTIRHALRGWLDRLSGSRPLGWRFISTAHPPGKVEAPRASVSHVGQGA